MPTTAHVSEPRNRAHRGSGARWLLLLPALALIVLTGCTDDPAPDDGTAAVAREDVPRDEVRDGGTLRLAVTALPDSFNPYRADPLSSAAEILAPTTGSAVSITAGGDWQVDPLYAESVEITGEDPLAVAVRLNPAAVWSDGSPIDAADMQAFVAAQQAAEGQQPSSATGWGNVAAVETGDDPFAYTVTFGRPTADWPDYVYPGLPAEAATPEAFNGGFTDDAIPANGPFVVAAIDREAGVVELERNPAWWGPEAKLERITWSVASTADQAEAFIDDDLDAMIADSGTIDVVGDHARVRRSAGAEWSHLTLNAGRGPLQEVEVRRAVAHAVDREAIAADVSGAVGAVPTTVGSVVLLPGQTGYRDTASGAFPHDPAEATRLLEAAGYATDEQGRAVDGDGAQLTLDLPVPAGTAPNLARAESVRDDLADVGIAVEIREVPADDFFETVIVPLDFDLVTFLWDGSAFPVGAAAARLFPIDSRQNFTGQGAEQLAEPLDRARGAIDPRTRGDAVAEVDAAVFEVVALIPLALEPQVMAISEELVNYGPSQFTRPDWTLVGFRA